MSGLRPLALGELIDRSVAFWRANWKQLFWLMLPFQLLQFIAIKAASAWTQAFFPQMANPAQLNELLKADPAQGFARFGAALAVFALAAAVMVLLSNVNGIAATRYVFPRVLGAEPGPEQTVSGATQFALTKLKSALGVMALSALWATGVGVVLVLPSVALLFWNEQLALLSIALALIALIVLLVWCLIRFMLQSQVLALESGGARHAFTRAGALAAGRIGPGLIGLVKVRLTLLMTVVGGILTLVSLATSMPTLLLALIYGATLTPGNTVDEVVPMGLLVGVQLAQVIVGSLAAPIFETLKVFFYVDMRVRREGLDLELGLQ